MLRPEWRPLVHDGLCCPMQTAVCGMGVLGGMRVCHLAWPASVCRGAFGVPVWVWGRLHNRCYMGGINYSYFFFSQLMSTKWIYTIWHKREERQSVKKQNPFWVLKFCLLRLQAFCILFSVIFFVLFAFLGRDSPPVYFFFFFFNFQ